MTIREAKIEDLPHIQEVRRAVKENRLSDPRKVTDEIKFEMHYMDWES